MEKPEISLVVPMYNEEDVIGIFIEKIRSALDGIIPKYEIVFINDGSNDSTWEIIRKYANEDDRIKGICLSRNFGKEAALSAGIDYAIGRSVIPIDCDLQDPPELIIDMYHKWKEGYQVVLARRADRSSDSFFKRFTSKQFYRIIDKMSDIRIPHNVGDFRLLDRAVIEVLKKFPEKKRFMKGLFASLGFKEYTLEYKRPVRAAGKTKWNYIKLCSLAIEGLVSFTTFPLKLWSYLGITISSLSFGYGLYLSFRTIFLGRVVPGYASMVVLLLFLNGLVLINLGIIGEYLSRVFYEVKNRPLYIVMDEVGISDQ